MGTNIRGEGETGASVFRIALNCSLFCFLFSTPSGSLKSPFSFILLSHTSSFLPYSAIWISLSVLYLFFHSLCPWEFILLLFLYLFPSASYWFTQDFSHSLHPWQIYTFCTHNGLFRVLVLPFSVSFFPMLGFLLFSLGDGDSNSVYQTT
jgi:hypothetical protein